MTASLIKIQKIALLIIVFLLPMGSGMNRHINFEISKFFILFVGVSIILQLIINGFKLKFEKTSLWFNLFFIFSIIHTMLFAIFHFKEFTQPPFAQSDPIYVNLIRLILLLSFSYLVSALLTKSFLKKMIISLSIGYVLTIIIAWTPIPTEVAGRIIGGDGRISAGFDNPNTFGVLSLVIVLLNLYLFVVKSKNKVIPLLCILIGIIGILGSQSRGALLMLVILALFLYWKSPGLKLKFRISVIIAILSFVVLLALPKSFYKATFERMNNHLTKSENNKIEFKESRLIIWGDYLRQWDDYVLYGKGMGRAIKVTEDDYNTWKPFIPHNKYINVLAEYGIIGFLLFIYALFSLFRKIYFNKIRFEDEIILSISYLWIFYFMLGSFENDRTLWLSYGILMGYGYLLQQNRSENNEEIVNS